MILIYVFLFISIGLWLRVSNIKLSKEAGLLVIVFAICAGISDTFENSYTITALERMRTNNINLLLSNMYTASIFKWSFLALIFTVLSIPVISIKRPINKLAGMIYILTTIVFAIGILIPGFRYLIEWGLSLMGLSFLVTSVLFYKTRNNPYHDL